MEGTRVGGVEGTRIGGVEGTKIGGVEGTTAEGIESRKKEECSGGVVKVEDDMEGDGEEEVVAATQRKRGKKNQNRINVQYGAQK